MSYGAVAPGEQTSVDYHCGPITGDTGSLLLGAHSLSPGRHCTYHTRFSVKTIKIYRTKLSRAACASKDFISEDPTTSKHPPNASNAMSWATSWHAARTSQCAPNAASPTTQETAPWRMQPQPVVDASRGNLP
ncbi:hypothetical protein CROQUDRAFT_93881 [Cronartium quercuum f. sp. fusiforme G11]|uniref:Uncharacterized protein n=1 Tax=Cronartium quercuum f. sp. fusiforme G11 TaxID=708437 RepID=A0A9P6TB79_9BASI|nr:hypothetical protein CROQUDRAFT_93881 [Cronartium quercuum f. sp. fusiforme G11]